VNIGLLGGAFNPVHNGHLAVAARAREALDLDFVLFLPAGNPPHKSHLLPFDVRYALIDAALREREHMFVSDLDRNTGATNFTFDLLLRVGEKYPGARLYFLIGDDNVEELQRWWRSPELFGLAQFVVFTREPRDGWSSLPYYHHLRFVPMEPVAASSTLVRRLLAQGQDISHYVPPDVAQYLTAHVEEA